MPEEFTAANAGAVDVAASTTPATSEPAQEQTNATQENTAVEGTTPQQATQEPTQTQAFAHRLAQETAKAKDATIAELGYIDAQGNPITTYNAYQQALQTAQQAERDAQLQQQTGVDPNALKPLFEEWKKNDPDFQSLQQSTLKSKLEGQMSELNKDFPELALKDITDMQKLPNFDAISKYYGQGLSIPEAYKLANFSTIKQTAQQSAVTQMINNGQSTPGSLASGEAVQGTDVWKWSKDDFKAYTEKALRGDLKK